MAHDYNFMDNNPENYPQKPHGGLTADQEAARQIAECWSLYANGASISIRDFDYVAFLNSANAQFDADQARLRDYLGQLEEQRRTILGREEEQRLHNMSR